MHTIRKILIVDDEPRMCDSLNVLLNQESYEIQAAFSGRHAIESLQIDTFDLIIIDMFLKDMNGLQLLEHVKKSNPDILVIIITGYASIESIIGALRGGAYDFIRKPFEPEELIKTVENALEQKKLKNENDIINKKLEVSEERYRYLVQNSPDLIYTLDKEGKFSFVNNFFEKLLGYNCDQLYEKHYTEIIHKDDIAKAKHFFNEKRTGERSTSGIELKLKNNKNGIDSDKYGFRQIIIELKAKGIYEKIDGGKKEIYLGTHGVARDITYRKHLESKLQQIQKMESLGTLAGGIAHDFNNILTGILGYTSLMLLDIDSSHTHYKGLKTIEQQIHNGTELVKQLLGFSRNEKLNTKQIDLNELIREVSDMIGRINKKITIHTNLQKDLWLVGADQIQLDQVLLNIFVNACQAMPEGGDMFITTRNISIDSQDYYRVLGVDPGDYIEITVSDMGIGMDQEIQQKIFEPFFTTKGKGAGTGLGLANVYSIIKNHGGNINVFSKKGEGTTFNIYLPASKIKLTKKDSPPVNIIRGNETILLVDDEDIIIDVGCKILNSLGYKTLMAKSAKEAINIYTTHKNEIALVILDMIMPGMGGGKAYLVLKEIDPDIKVILSSGYGVEGQASEILRNGCNGFLQKPFSIKELSLKLRDVLD